MHKFVFALGCVLAVTAATQAQTPTQLTGQQSALPDAPSSVLAARSGDLQLVAASQPASAPSGEEDAVQAAQSSSSSAQQATPDAPAPQQDDAAARRARAAAQLKKEESQRVAGIIPTFNGVLDGHADPLTAGQKFHLFFKSAFDPYQFALTAIDTGIQEGEDSYPEYHHGIPGLLRNYGASFGDSFDGNFWGNAVLPSLLHQDPRYFRLGHGSFWHRFLYSASTTVRAKNDKGHWQPNYSNVAGNIIGGAISNLYYPDSDRGIGLTFQRAFTVTAEGTFGAELIEFYPDVTEHIKRAHARKLARKAAEAQAQADAAKQQAAPATQTPAATPPQQ